MIKIKDVTRLNAFGYKKTAYFNSCQFFVKDFENKYTEEHAHISINENTGIVSAVGDAMDELLDEIFELKSAGLLVRISDDEKG